MRERHVLEKQIKTPPTERIKREGKGRFYKNNKSLRLQKELDRKGSHVL
jgi:hypothetical protein